MNTLKPIRNEAEYQAALEELESVFDATSGSAESDYAEVLVTLINRFEDEYYSIEAPDPIEAIKIRMEDLQLSTSDLMKLIGTTSRGTVSNILNRRRPLTLPVIRILGPSLGIPFETLIKEYPLHTA